MPACTLITAACDGKDSNLFPLILFICLEKNVFVFQTQLSMQTQWIETVDLDTGR